MTNTTNESEAMEVWLSVRMAHERAYEDTPGPIGARSRIIAADQAAARVIATALEARDAEALRWQSRAEHAEVLLADAKRERGDAYADAALVSDQVTHARDQLAELLAGATDSPEELAKCLRGDAWYGVANLVEGIPAILAILTKGNTHG